MKLQVIPILACIYAVAAHNELDEFEAVVHHYSHSLQISTEKVRNCINKTKVTLDDIYAFPRLLDDVDLDPDSKGTQRRGACFMVCVTQEKGLMIESKFQMTKIHDEIEREVMQDERKPILHAAADTCADEVKHISDACQVGLQFAQCIVKKMQAQTNEV